jgi:hypothetical protein
MTTSKLTVPAKRPKRLIISTSDRASFRTCRQKWEWGSHLRMGLQAKDQRKPLWIGSGMHHVLEDYHGDRHYATVADGVADYLQATRKYYGAENLPPTVDSDVELMVNMLTHYTEGFLATRSPLTTYRPASGEAQVEVPFEIELPLSKKILDAAGCTSVIYRGLFDRVTIDEDGYLWLNDYKNVASRTKLINLELDPQIGAYMWAASYMYDIPVMGFIYTQLKKTAVVQPRVLKDGKISSAADQNTTHRLYRQALVSLYGENSAVWPAANMECLNSLALHEEEDRDKFVGRDYISRSKNSMQKEVERLLMEVEEMLNPELSIYPNPSYRCAETCSFQTPCIEKYKMENFEATLASEYVADDYANRNSWRDHLKIGLVETPTFVIKP